MCYYPFWKWEQVLFLVNFRSLFFLFAINYSFVLSLTDTNHNVYGYFMPLQEKILLTDGHVIGFRGDYNGVLLLDTVLQTPVPNNDDCIRLEMLLSEAILFQTCLRDLEQDLECPYDLQNELMEKIKIAQSNSKKGIKAQRVSESRIRSKISQSIKKGTICRRPKLEPRFM